MRSTSAAGKRTACPTPDAGQLTLHLAAADGASFILQIPAPVVSAPVTVRVAGVQLAGVQAVYQWDGTAWSPAPLT